MDLKGGGINVIFWPYELRTKRDPDSGVISVAFAGSLDLPIFSILGVLVFMLLFFAGTAPDVMKWDGANWHKPPVEHPSATPHH